MHLGAYFALAWLWGVGGFLAGHMDSAWRWHLIIGWLAANAFGLGIEAVQHTFVEDRYFDIFDILANATGTTLGVWGVVKAKPRAA